MSELHVDSVLKTYAGKSILSDIYLSCKSGEVLGLFGRNGSGKSTLLKIICGAISSESSYRRIDKEVIFGPNSSIKYLPQDTFLPSDLTVKTILSLYAKGDNLELLKSHFLVKPFLLFKPKVLSAGERRVLEILLLIFSDATFILLDEPFNGVAPVLKDEITILIKKNFPQKGFIITDHDYRSVLDISNRYVYLSNGSLKNIDQKERLSDLGYLSPNSLE